MWQIKKLEEICNFQNGFAFKSKFFKSSGLPVLRISNIQNENLETEDLVFFDPKDYKENFVKFRVEKGDLVIAMSGATTGKLGINNSDTVFYLNQRVGKFLPKENLAKKYLHYFLSTRVEENLRISAGSAQPNLSTEQIKNLEIPLPPIDEQKRIVGILDEVFEGVAKAKENVEGNLRNVSEVFEAYLQNVFADRSGWLEKRLDQVGDTQTGSTPKTSEKENFGNFIPFIKPADFNKDGSLNYENDGLSEIGLKKSRLIEKGSVMMVCIGATIGKCGFCDRDVTANQQINSLKPTKNILHKLIYYQMLTENFQSRVIFGSGQATLPIINKSKWSALKVVFPADIEEQKSIVTKLDALSTETKKLEAIYKTKLNHLEELKKSILKKAFNGEL